MRKGLLLGSSILGLWVSPLLAAWNTNLMLPNAAAEGMSIAVQLVSWSGAYTVKEGRVWVAIPDFGVNPNLANPVVIGEPIYTDSIGNRVATPGARAWVVQLPVFILEKAVAGGVDSATFWIVDTTTYDTAGLFVVFAEEALPTIVSYSAANLSGFSYKRANYLMPGPPVKWALGTIVIKNLIIYDTLYLDATDTTTWPTNYGYRQGIPFTMVVKDTVIVGNMGASAGVLVVLDGQNGGTWNNQVPSSGSGTGANGDYFGIREGGGPPSGYSASFGPGGAAEQYGNPMLVPYMGGSAGGAYGNHKCPGPAWGGNGGGFLGLFADGPITFDPGTGVLARGGNYKQVSDSRAGGGSGGAVVISAGVNAGGLTFADSCFVLTPGGSGSADRGGDGRVRTDGAIPDTTAGTFFAGTAMDTVFFSGPDTITVRLLARPNSTVMLYNLVVDTLGLGGTLHSVSLDVGPGGGSLVDTSVVILGSSSADSLNLLWAVNVGLVSDWTTILYAYMSAGATEILRGEVPLLAPGEEGPGFGILRVGEALPLGRDDAVYSPLGTLITRGGTFVPKSPGVYVIRARGRLARVICLP